MTQSTFSERRKQYRLPYEERVIFTDGQRSVTAYAANISRGGVFVMTLDPFPIDTEGHLAFFLPSQEKSLCVRAKVVHIVFDWQRSEIECGMGFQFLDLDESHKSIMNLHILNEQATYLELRKILALQKPSAADLSRCLRRLSALKKHDLLFLRYRVNRICTLFDPVAPALLEDVDENLDTESGADLNKVPV